MICCLAVDPDYRKQGVASILLRKALDELDRSREITVSTFRENDEKGLHQGRCTENLDFRKAS